MTDKHFIYLLSCTKHAKLYKVGITENVERRVKEVNHSSKGLLDFTVVRAIEVSKRDARHIETNLKRHYRNRKLLAFNYALFDGASEILVSSYKAVLEPFDNITKPYITKESLL